MLWIERDPDGNYALHEWQVEDEETGEIRYEDVVVPFDDPDHGCDWSAVKPSWLKDQGTVIVLLGDSAHADTIDGDPDPARKETAGGMVRYLNGRLLDIPERKGKRVDTTIEDIEYPRARPGRSASKDTVIELPSGKAIVLHQRKVNGLRNFIPTQAQSGEVIVDEHGTRVEWTYVPAPTPPVSGSADYRTGTPVVCVDYQGEAYHVEAKQSRYRQFGVTDEIRGRTWLIVKPPVYSDQEPTKWGVLTHASRFSLHAKGGGELPWDAWGDAFYAKFPATLAQARDEARSANTAQTDPAMAKNLARILDRLNPRFRASRLLAAAAGKLRGTDSDERAGNPNKRTPRPFSPTPHPRPSGGGGGTKGTGKILTPASTGDTRGETSDVRAGYPGYKWDTFDAEEAIYLARFDENDDLREGTVVFRGVVHLNDRHPVFVEDFRHWTQDVWPKADSDKVIDLIQRIYGEEAVAHVVHARRLSGTTVATDANGPVIIGKDDVEKLVSIVALSSAMLGLVNVEQRILTAGGGLFGKAAA